MSSLTTPEHPIVYASKVIPEIVYESTTVPEGSTNYTLKSSVVRAEDGLRIVPKLNYIKATEENGYIP